jgi:alkanesulfonate monooxygenase SsuD/methylene tetrahydromethanopterin reductase-like flavin-dependent oxidoreductase (luciferase family)
MWSDNDGPYHGKHYQLAETINVPQPIRRPPIMIGGGGERKTLRLVARYADACNLFGGGGQEGLDTVRGKLEVLREHCANEGTDYDAIRKTMLFRGLGGTDAASAAKAAEDLAPYADLGVTSVFFTHIGDPARFVGELGEHVIPALSAV